MSERVAPLREIMALNTRLFRNTLSGVDDASAQVRPGPEANNMTFIAVHLLDARAWMTRYLGIQYRHPFEDELANVSSIDDVERFPSLVPIIADWNEVSERLSERLASLTEEEMARESEQEFPISDRSVLGGLAFLLQHESFHIGQLALIRRILGFGAMSYADE
jgi:hypothetical protein